MKSKAGGLAQDGRWVSDVWSDGWRSELSGENRKETVSPIGSRPFVLIEQQSAAAAFGTSA